jgi:hypothetical protein
MTTKKNWVPLHLRPTAAGILAVISILGFCIYRMVLLRPLPLDSPGTLRPTLYHWYRLYTGLFTGSRDAYSVWYIACYVLVVSFPLLALLNYLWRRKTIRLPYRLGTILCSQGVFWLSYGVYLFLCRFPVLLRNELNPDEGQFLASAYKLFYDPNFYHAVDCHTSGPGNIYPLMWPAIFGVSPDFASSRIVGLIAIYLSVYLLYRTIALITSDDLARIAILPVGAAFPVFATTELLYYTSEHIPVLLLSFVLFLSVRVLVRPQAYRVPAFLLGLVACASFFTKIQSVPIATAAVAVTFVFLLARNEGRTTWRAVLFFAAGAVTPALANTLLCLKGRVCGDFLQGYVIANIDYSTSGSSLAASIRSFLQYATSPPELKLFFITFFVIALGGMVQGIRADLKYAARTRIRIFATLAAILSLAFIGPADRLLVYFFLGVAACCLTPVYFFVLSRRGSLGVDPVRWFGFLALMASGAAFFSVYKAHREFVHYLFFLFIPLGILLAWILVREAGRLRLLPHLIVGMTLACTAYLWSFQAARAFDIAEMIRAPEGDFIRSVTTPEGQIFVWGWTALPYLASGRVPATRETLVGNLFRGYNVMTFPPEFHPTQSSERVSAYYRSRELQDLKANPPELFIDAIGPASWFLSSSQYFGFERVPDIAAFVNANYVHLTDLYRERYFLRRDLAAKREAQFDRPLPLKACAAQSVRCLDSPVTLPLQLPAIQMPARYRIEAEFMPIGSQIGTATVFNSEARPNSFQGFRLQHVTGDRYTLLVGLGNEWAVSNHFELPEGKPAFVTIETDGHRLRIENNGSRLDELHLSKPIADAPGPITIGSWIDGMCPFSGKVQFFQIIDLDK